jgi:cytoskeleton protein RodZ
MTENEMNTQPVNEHAGSESSIAANIETVVETSVEQPISQSLAAEQMNTAASADQPALGPGAQLALQRLAQGLTIEQVANQLNLAPRQIQALEVDNYSALPGYVIARGFIRAYAKLLKIDPAPFVALMPGEVKQMESLELKRALAGSYSESRLPPQQNSNIFTKWNIAIAVLALLVSAGLAAQWLGWLDGIPNAISDSAEKDTMTTSTNVSNLAFQEQNKPEGAPKSAEPIAAPAVNSAVNDTSPAAARTAESGAATKPAAKDKDVIQAPAQTAKQAPAAVSVPASPQQPTAAKPAVKDVNQSSLQAAKPAAPQIAAALPTPTPAVTAKPVQPAARTGELVSPEDTKASNKSVVMMRLKEDSWVEVRDSADNILISRLMMAGTTETFSVPRPLTLTIGNAAGVEVTLRGKPIDVGAATKGNIARINLK